MVRNNCLSKKTELRTSALSLYSYKNTFLTSNFSSVIYCIYLFFLIFFDFTQNLFFFLYVRTFPGCLVQLSMRCVWLVPDVGCSLCTWPNSLWNVFDLYLSLCYFPVSRSSSQPGLFDLYFMLGYFPGTSHNSLQSVFDLHLMSACFPRTWPSSLRGMFDLYLTLWCVF